MNKIKLGFIISLAIAALAVSGCGRKPSPDDKVLVKVSDTTITVGEFKARIAKMPVYYRKIVERNKKRYLEDVIVEKLFYEDAVRKGLNRDKEVLEIVNQAKKKVVIGKLIENEVDKKVTVAEDEMRKYYEAHKDEFKTPELWRASHILVATEKEASDILDALSKNAKFEDLAREKSMDATASRGGDIGFFRVGQLVPDFEKACLKLKIGETSGIVQTQFGYHIIKLTDRKEPGAEDFDRAKGKIESELKKKKRIDAFNKLVMDLKGKYGVEIKEDVFNAMENAGGEGRQEGAK